MELNVKCVQSCKENPLYETGHKKYLFTKKSASWSNINFNKLPYTVDVLKKETWIRQGAKISTNVEKTQVYIFLTSAVAVLQWRISGWSLCHLGDETGSKMAILPQSVPKDITEQTFIWWH